MKGSPQMKTWGRGLFNASPDSVTSSASTPSGCLCLLLCGARGPTPRYYSLIPLQVDTPKVASTGSATCPKRKQLTQGPEMCFVPVCPCLFPLQPHPSSFPHVPIFSFLGLPRTLFFPLSLAIRFSSLHPPIHPRSCFFCLPSTCRYVILLCLLPG